MRAVAVQRHINRYVLFPGTDDQIVRAGRGRDRLPQIGE